jgi:hypothetical protein
MPVKEATLKRYGLYSGNRPGFYKGKPDPATHRDVGALGPEVFGGAGSSR